MGNRLEGTASFTYEGQEYRLTLNNRTLMHAEDVLDYSALDAAEEAQRAMAMGRNPMLRTVVALFYGALVVNHPGITEDDAIEMFLDADDSAAQEAFKAVLTSIDPPKPVGNGRAAQVAAKPKRGTGKASSVRTAKRASGGKSSS